MGRKKVQKSSKKSPSRGGKAGLRETTPAEMGKAVPESLAAIWAKLRKQPAVTVTWLADCLGFASAPGKTSGRPKQLTDDGIITRRPGGKCGPEAILEYVCWLRDRAEARDTSARGLIEQEKLRTLRRENDQAEGRVFPVEVLQAALERTVAAWVVVLEAVAVNWKREFPETTGDELEHVKKFVAELRNKLAQAAIDIDD